MTLAESLARCPLFEGLEPADLERAARGARSLGAPGGTLIFREGEPFEGFYVLLEGLVRIYKVAPGGREHTLHIMRPPNSFAEAVLFGGGAYPAFAEAMEDSRVVLVYREPFLRLLEERPGVALRMLESMSKWLHRLLDKLETETFLSARSRLAAWLLREARRGGAGREAREIELPLARKDLAAQLGMAPETLSRAQADLEARGSIAVAGRKIRIPDPVRLEDSLLEAGPRG